MTIFEALAEPARQDLLAQLRRGERPVGALVDALGVAQPSVSKHLKVLKEAGLVRVRVDGPRRLYSLDPAPLAALDAWLAPYRRFWADKLDALGEHLKRSD